MKAIWTERSYGFDHFVGGYPVGSGSDKITFEAFDKDNNQFTIAYKGKRKLPSNLHEFDIDIEVKFTLTPKKADSIVTEFK